MFKEMWKVLARYGIVPWNNKELLGVPQPTARSREDYWQELVDERQTEEHKEHGKAEDSGRGARGAKGTV